MAGSLSNIVRDFLGHSDLTVEHSAIRPNPLEPGSFFCNEFTPKFNYPLPPDFPQQVTPLHTFHNLKVVDWLGCRNFKTVKKQYVVRFQNLLMYTQFSCSRQCTSAAIKKCKVHLISHIMLNALYYKIFWRLNSFVRVCSLLWIYAQHTCAYTVAYNIPYAYAWKHENGSFVLDILNRKKISGYIRISCSTAVDSRERDQTVNYEHFVPRRYGTAYSNSTTAQCVYVWWC